MLEAIENFEMISLYFAPAVLVVPGLACLGFGLCLWLGGLQWSRLAAAFPGALAGVGCGFLIARENSFAIAVITMFGAGLAMVFEKAALTLAGAITVFILVLIFFAGNSPKTAELWQYPHYEISADTKRSALDRTQSISIMRTQLAFFGEKSTEGLRNVPAAGFAVSIIAGLVAGACGVFVPRPVSAMTFAISGTALIFAGMILLLLYKGANPITHIYGKISFYVMVAAAMTAFGTTTELLLCPAKAKKHDNEKNDTGDKP